MKIEQIISEYDVTEIVVGYPKNMDDTIGERAKACEEFAAALERRTGLPVTLWDERLTTVEADEVLEECGMRRENRKTVIDQLAAVFRLLHIFNQLILFIQKVLQLDFFFTAGAKRGAV